MERMYALGPQFIDVTWGAGGTTSDLTLEICKNAQAVYGLETSMHLTCTNMPREKVDRALKEAKASGIKNILALRGDPPRGQSTWQKCENGFAHAVDLVRHIKKEYADYFCISVAGYPEGHIENEDRELDMKFLKEKVDAGADYIVTQLFYDTDLFLNWVTECRKVGIKCPIIPGIMPIQSYGGFTRMTTLCKTLVPKHITEELEPIKNDDQAVKDYGVKLAIDMCTKLRKNGIRGFHFYTLNLEKSVRLILEGLGFVDKDLVTKPLPFNPSLAENRSKENVRPIFWKNRPRSYVSRTETWDEFPNGRWGDSRSPAFGELDGYGISLKYSKDHAKDMWIEPKSLNDVFQMFCKYCKGELQALPWYDQPPSAETKCIEDKLVQINKSGFLTINSQPAVNGAPSSDKIFGWGPRNGYVYQKAYLEFFVDSSKLKALVSALAEIEKEKNSQTISFYAVSSDGTLMSNNEQESCDGSDPESIPNAVTWGVFPGKEIVQPTVVDKNSFLAWKDEAFLIWKEWADIYDKGSKAHDMMIDISKNWYLVNMVENDYIEGDIFRVFDLITSENNNQ